MQGNRSSRRLTDRLAGMLRPASLLRSPCNTSSTCTTSTAPTALTNPPTSANSSTLALLLARDQASLTASCRHATIARAESFSAALDRLHRSATAPTSPLPTVDRYSLDLPPPVDKKKKKKKERSSSFYARRHRLVGFKKDQSMKLASNPYGFSSSGDDADTDSEKDDTEAFFSSRSFSSDSSDLYAKKKKWHGRRRHMAGCDTCSAKDGLRPVLSAAGKAPEAEPRREFAVVKRSSDPYRDFRASMAEMILERHMSSAAEMERLLRSYLSLNAPHHHPVILQAFSDVWLLLHGR